MNQCITLESTIRRIEEVVTADLGGDVGMMHIEKGMYYAFNDVGTRIWELIEEPRTVGDIVSVMCGEYKVDAETCREQVLEFLNMLRKSELVHVA